MTAEDSRPDTHEGLTQDTHEGLTQDTHEGLTQDTHEGLTQDTHEGLTQDTHEGLTQDTHEGLTRDTVQELERERRMLPYSLIVGQEELRTALEIAYVSPGVGGVLATGQRGTAKTTTVRAFTTMAVGEFPVTLPIGATDDRVLGGWEIPELMHGESKRAEGLLERAARSKSRMLYVDEINLLDDYLVNIILDVASTGVLPLERDHHSEDLRNVEFTLVGTMNPDEGGLRPQLLDRFGLVATVESEATDEQRQRIVETVLRFEAERDDTASEFIGDALRLDSDRKAALDAARDRVTTVRYDTDVVARCARLAQDFALAGHRGELVLMRAARALAAIEGAERVSRDHVRRVARPALVHRRGRGDTGTFAAWTDQDDERVRAVLDDRTD